MTAATGNERKVYWARTSLVLVMTGSALGLSALGALPLSWPAALAAALGYVTLSWAQLALMRRLPGSWQHYGQTTVDIAWITAFVRITGGTENNSYALLFFLAIIAASNVRFVRGAIYAATVASIGYAGLLWMDLLQLQRAYGLSARAELPSAFSASFYLNGCVYAICFYLVAAFSGYLAERVRLKGRQLEQAAQALEDFRLSTGDILEKMGSGLLTLTAAGAIKYCNAAGCQILGLAAPDILGRNIDDSLGQGLAPLLAILRRGLADGNQAVRREIAITRADGAEVPIGISTTPIRDGAPIQGLIAVFQDLTEIKRAESRVLEIEQL
ncbi:MAG TPA: PAS domain S-box protein, partial [Candidatus Edwardsbacteria bacterium]|nr:PAS domain S-box protein [Candidatus Edwardsbacteria bacterium]